jgi:molecular chaperone DnaK (HSP70)
MPIIRVTKKQIEAANKAREAALEKDDDFRRYQEQRQRFEEIAKAREAALKKNDDSRRSEERCRHFEQVTKAREAALKNDLKAAADPKEEQIS